jgi:adenylate kinase
MRLVLLGCPGAGKGTQSRRLAEKYGLAHIATGDLLRAEIKEKTALGLKVEGYLNKGMLVPDEIMVEMVAPKLDQSSKGFILDGFPRTLAQAQALDKYLKSNRLQIDLVLCLAMEEKAVVARLTSRRSCSACGEVYNVNTRPPKVEGKCDKCGGEVVQREDDSETTVRKRLMVYEDLTRPLVAYYKNEYEFQEVNGAQDVDAVTKELSAIIDRNRNGGASPAVRR